MIDKNELKDIVFGVAVGDALGVPVEFLARKELKAAPLTDMIGWGSHNQPSGTWSDDTSLTLCTAKSILEGYDVKKLTQYCIDWAFNNEWTPHGIVFDIGNTTRWALGLRKKDAEIEFGNEHNGNGALMRIMPVYSLVKDKSIEDTYTIVNEISSITHGHYISVISCLYLLTYAKELMKVKSLPNAKQKALHFTNQEVKNFLHKNTISYDKLERLFDTDNFSHTFEDDIHSSGYVIHTLESSIWSFLNTVSYKDAVIKGVNLGSDTDTTGAVVGGLAGLFYGYDSIPQEWIQLLAKKDFIFELLQ